MASNNNFTIDSAARRNKTFLNLYRTICYVVLILLAVISIFPFLTTMVNGTRPNYDVGKSFSLIPGRMLIPNVKSLFSASRKDTTPFLTGMKNSFLIATIATVLTTYFSALTAYAIHVYNFKLKKFFHTFILLVMMIPAQISAVGFYQLMHNWGLNDTFLPLTLPAIAAPATYFFMICYMDSALPLDIVEAARIDGSNEYFTFNRIVMPILKPAIAVQAIFAFVTSWNNYFMPALLLDYAENKTLPLMIYSLMSSSFQNLDRSLNNAAITLCVFPLIVVYLFLSKFIIRGIALGSVKG